MAICCSTVRQGVGSPSWGQNTTRSHSQSRVPIRNWFCGLVQIATKHVSLSSSFGYQLCFINIPAPFGKVSQSAHLRGSSRYQHRELEHRNWMPGHPSLARRCKCGSRQFFLARSRFYELVCSMTQAADSDYAHLSLVTCGWPANPMR